MRYEMFRKKVMHRHLYGSETLSKDSNRRTDRSIRSVWLGDTRVTILPGIYKIIDIGTRKTLGHGKAKFPNDSMETTLSLDKNAS